MILRENTLCVAIGEEHRAYVREVLEWNEFSKAILSRLDMTVRSVATTICASNGANVDFNAGMLLQREESLLVGWARNMLAADDALIVFFNPCAEKKDKDLRAQWYKNVVYYHDSVLNEDKVLHLVFPGAPDELILESFRASETSEQLFVGVALRGVRFEKSELYKDISHERLFELLDCATHAIIEICDGEAWCLWPMISVLSKASKVTKGSFTGASREEVRS